MGGVVLHRQFLEVKFSKKYQLSILERKSRYAAKSNSDKCDILWSHAVAYFILTHSLNLTCYADDLMRFWQSVQYLFGDTFQSHYTRSYECIMRQNVSL